MEVLDVVENCFVSHIFAHFYRARGATTPDDLVGISTPKIRPLEILQVCFAELSPDSCMDIRAEATRQNVTVVTSIRIAVQRYLLAMTEVRLAASRDPRLDPNSSLNLLVSWTLAEQRFADEILRIHFDEDP